MTWLWRGLNTNMDESGTSELLSMQVPENTQEYDQSDEWGTVSPVEGYCIEAVSVSLCMAWYGEVTVLVFQLGFRANE